MADARLRPRTARPARDRAPARHALSRRPRTRECRWCSGSTRRRSRRRSRSRDADTGELVAAGRASASADVAAAQRAGPGRVVGRAARRRRAVGRGGARRSPRSRSPASSTAWWCSTPHDQVVRPAKLWNDTESAPDARLADRSARDGGRRRRVGDGVRIGAGRRVHDHEAVVAAP